MSVSRVRARERPELRLQVGSAGPRYRREQQRAVRGASAHLLQRSLALPLPVQAGGVVVGVAVRLR